MHRIFLVLALAAAAFGAWVLFTSPDPASFDRAGQSAGGALRYSEWALGLLMGLALAWLAAIDWRDFPQRFAAWLKLQRRRLALLILGGACASVLLLF